MSISIYRAKNYFVLIIISLSIFFSHSEILLLDRNFEIKDIKFENRFLIFFLIPLVMIDLIKNRKSFNFLIIPILVCFLLLIHSFFFKIFFFKIDYLNLNEILKYSNIKSIFQVIIFCLTFYILYHYRDLLKNNVFNIAKISLYSFFLCLTYYYFFGQYNLIKIISDCSYGFFSITKFLFKENSHFGLSAAPLLIFFTFNIKKLFTDKLTLIIYLIFLFFCLLNISLTIFLIILFGSFGLIIILNKNYFSKLYLVVLMIVSTIFFINQTNNCQLKNNDFYKKNQNYELNQKSMHMNLRYSGINSSGKKKLSQLFNSKNNYNDNYFLNLFLDEENNLSVRVFFSSLDIAFRSLQSYPFGVGLDNYNHAYLEITDERRKELYSDPKLYLTKRNLCEIQYCCLVCLDSFNKNDGSINFSKFLTEFGIFSLIFFSITFYKSFSNHIDLNIKVLYYPMIFSQLFIRGSGYFYNGFFIVMILVIIAIYMRSNENKR